MTNEANETLVKELLDIIANDSENLERTIKCLTDDCVWVMEPAANLRGRICHSRSHRTLVLDYSSQHLAGLGHERALFGHFLSLDQVWSRWPSYYCCRLRCWHCGRRCDRGLVLHRRTDCAIPQTHAASVVVPSPKSFAVAFANYSPEILESRVLRDGDLAEILGANTVIGTEFLQTSK